MLVGRGMEHHLGHELVEQALQTPEVANVCHDRHQHQFRKAGRQFALDMKERGLSRIQHHDLARRIAG